MERDSQIERYKTYTGPVRYSTWCRMLGCRRVFGRKGLIFCTEGCCDGDCSRKAGEPAPKFTNHDFDDTWDAATVLNTVVGPPPANVVYRRWQFDPETGEDVLQTIPEGWKEPEEKMERGESRAQDSAKDPLDPDQANVAEDPVDVDQASSAKDLQTTLDV